MASSSSSGQQQQGDHQKQEQQQQRDHQKQEGTDTCYRKRKRMQSNRESARRSRLRKQNHLDDLTVQVAELKAQNSGIISTTSTSTQLYLEVEAENSVLRAQLSELSNRLQSLNDIMINCLSNNNVHGNIINNNNNNNNNVMRITTSTTSDGCSSDDQEISLIGSFDVDLEFDDDDFSMNSWGFSFANYPTTTPDVFMC